MMKEMVKKTIKKVPALVGVAKKLDWARRKAIARRGWTKLQKSGLPIFLELGSGEKKGQNGWITIDIKGADIDWDLRDGIPLSDRCVDKIYSSHLLEHIPYGHLILFLKECKRVLKSDGEFSVCVPNAGAYLNGYFSGKAFVNQGPLYQPAVVDTGSRMDMLNYIAYMDNEHKYMFDPENLVNTLKRSGFGIAELRGFDPKIDLKERDFESIYAIAKI